MKYFSFRIKREISPDLLNLIEKKAASISGEPTQLTKSRVFVFLSKACGEGLEGCVLYRQPLCREGEAGAAVQAFMAALGNFHANESVQAIREDESVDLLLSAFRRGYVQDVDAVLDALGLFRLRSVLGDIGVIRQPVSTERLLSQARAIPCLPGLSQEVERVLQTSDAWRCPGHPVHYLLEMEKGRERQEAVEVLLESLYAMRRLQRRRFQIMRFPVQGSITPGVITKVIEGCAGGALILDFGVDDARMIDRGCSERFEVLEALEAFRKYERKVLGVVCCPPGWNAVGNLLRETVPDVAFLVIRQEGFSREEALERLSLLAVQAGAEPDEQLYASVGHGDRSFWPDKLEASFGSWYGGYLRRVVYPQYDDLSGVVNGSAASGEKEGVVCNKISAYDKLQAMVGLRDAKQAVAQVLAAHRADKLYREHGMPGGVRPMHMVFAGSPGTAKTSVARLYAQILKEEGVLSQGGLVEVSRSDLVGKYVGWTARLVKENFEKARGSVLFIDEAYSLFDGRFGSFGEEAINTLVLEMENNRDDTVVILAGYLDRMEELLRQNPGLRSRFGFQVRFDDYSPEEMMTILRVMAEERGFRLNDGVSAHVLPLLEQASRTPNAGNGRFVRNLLDKALMRQSERLLALAPEDLTDNAVRTLAEGDFAMPQILPMAPMPLIGFH